MTAATVGAVAAIALVMLLLVIEPPLWVLAIAAVFAWATLALVIRDQNRPRYRRGRGDE